MTSVFVKVSNIPAGIDERDLAITLHEHMDTQVKKRFLSCEVDRKGELAVLEFEAGSLLNMWASLEKIIVNGKPLSVLNKDGNNLHTASSVSSISVPANNITPSVTLSALINSITPLSSVVANGVHSFSLPANGTVSSVLANGVGLLNSPTVHEEMDLDEGVASGESSPMPEGEGCEEHIIEQPPVAVVNPMPVVTPLPLVAPMPVVTPLPIVAPMPVAKPIAVSVPNTKPLSVSGKADTGVNGKVVQVLSAVQNGKLAKVQPVPKKSRVVPVNHHVVFFDLETTGLDQAVCEIVQIAAACGEQTYNVFMMPLRGVPPDASRINGLKVVGKNLLKNGRVVQVTDPISAWNGFIDFLGNIGSVILVAHYGDKFDFPLLARDIRKHGLASELRSIVTGCVDSIDIFRIKLRGRRSYKQVDLANHFGISTAAAHDALGDVLVLSQLFGKVGVTAADIKKKRNPLTRYL